MSKQTNNTGFSSALLEIQARRIREQDKLIRSLKKKIKKLNRSADVVDI